MFNESVWAAADAGSIDPGITQYQTPVDAHMAIDPMHRSSSDRLRAVSSKHSPGWSAAAPVLGELSVLINLT